MDLGFLHRHPFLESLHKIPENHVIVGKSDWEKARSSELIIKSTWDRGLKILVIEPTAVRLRSKMMGLVEFEETQKGNKLIEHNLSAPIAVFDDGTEYWGYRIGEDDEGIERIRSVRRDWDHILSYRTKGSYAFVYYVLSRPIERGKERK